MKRIGFVDYYISEWHANNYPNWINAAAEGLGLEYKVCYCWAEKYESPVDSVNTDQWCEKYGVEKCNTIEELCEKSDVIIILAPSNPETHLRYAKAVLPFKKRTYIDKTFAPDFATATEIVELAKECGTPFFTTSALRYASELSEFNDVRNVIVTGGGGNLDEYIIHNVEMAVALMKGKFQKVKVESVGRQAICRCATEDGREAVLLFSYAMEYSVTAEDGSKRLKKKTVASDFFKKLIETILVFFENGKTPFDLTETLEVMRVREGLIKAFAQDGEWVEL